MSIEGQGHFFTIYFPGFVCFVLYKATSSGERLQDHWSSGYITGTQLQEDLYAGVLTMSDTNEPVQLHRPVRGLKFLIQKQEGSRQQNQRS